MSAINTKKKWLEGQQQDQADDFASAAPQSAAEIEDEAFDFATGEPNDDAYTDAAALSAAYTALEDAIITNRGKGATIASAYGGGARTANGGIYSSRAIKPRAINNVGANGAEGRGAVGAAGDPNVFGEIGEPGETDEKNETGVINGTGIINETGETPLDDTAGDLGGQKSRQKRHKKPKMQKGQAKAKKEKPPKKERGAAPARRTGRRKRKKRWLILLIIILIAAAIFIFNAITSGGAMATQVRFSEINKGDLKNVVSVKGNVLSNVKRNVYSTLNLTVQSVEAEVGDTVQEGQTLCLLDKDDLELSLEQQKIDLEVSVKSSDLQIESSERTYGDAAENLRSGSNSQILSAEAAVRNAQVSLDTAQSNYNNLQHDYNNGTNASRISAVAAVNSAQTDLENREFDHLNNAMLFAAGAISRDSLHQSETAYNNAQTRLNDALTSLENTKTAEERSLEQSRNSLRSAQTTYNNALTSLSSAQRAAEQELTRYESNVESSKVGANTESKQIALRKLEKQLADSVIISPVDGIVTAVYAKEGGSGSGLLFIVEDPDNLKVNVRVKEFDAGKLVPGMPVSIKADAVSGAEYTGTLQKIEPAAVKNAMGETDTASDIEYGAEISIDSKGTLLRIGMNTRLDIIIEQRDDVFYVPYDAVTTNQKGESIVYAIEEVAMPGGGKFDSAGGGNGADGGGIGGFPGAGTGAGTGAGAGNDARGPDGGGNGMPGDGIPGGGGNAPNPVLGLLGGLLATKPPEPGYVAREIPVTVGLETDFYVEVAGAGLEGGMKIINEPSDANIFDGSPVTYQGAAADAPGRAGMPGVRIAGGMR